MLQRRRQARRRPRLSLGAAQESTKPSARINITSIDAAVTKNKQGLIGMPLG
jgi:hypothetical protein